VLRAPRTAAKKLRCKGRGLAQGASRTAGRVAPGGNRWTTFNRAAPTSSRGPGRMLFVFRVFLDLRTNLQFSKRSWPNADGWSNVWGDDIREFSTDPFFALPCSCPESDLPWTRAAIRGCIGLRHRFNSNRVCSLLAYFFTDGPQLLVGGQFPVAHSGVLRLRKPRFFGVVAFLRPGLKRK